MSVMEVSFTRSAVERPWTCIGYATLAAVLVVFLIVGAAAADVVVPDVSGHGHDATFQGTPPIKVCPLTDTTPTDRWRRQRIRKYRT